jgi:hypothetical protein
VVVGDDEVDDLAKISLDEGDVDVHLGGRCLEEEAVEGVEHVDAGVEAGLATSIRARRPQSVERAHLCALLEETVPEVVGALVAVLEGKGDNAVDGGLGGRQFAEDVDKLDADLAYRIASGELEAQARLVELAPRRRP